MRYWVWFSAAKQDENVNVTGQFPPEQHGHGIGGMVQAQQAAHTQIYQADPTAGEVFSLTTASCLGSANHPTHRGLPGPETLPALFLTEVLL